MVSEPLALTAVGLDEDPDVIIGPRYRYEDVRPGAGGSIVLEVNGENWRGRQRRGDPVKIPLPMSGPIHRRQTGDDPRRWYACCAQCGRMSKPYVRQNERAMFQWGHQHRCLRRSPKDYNPHAE